MYKAYLGARRSKRYKEYVLDFSWDVEKELRKLQKELINKTYQHRNYYEFTLHDAKKREIKAASFRDRVVHHKKVSPFPLCNGIDFLGYRIYGNYQLIRDNTVRRFIKNVKSKKTRLEKEESIRSWFSFVSYAKTFHLRQVINSRIEFPDL